MKLILNHLSHPEEVTVPVPVKSPLPIVNRSKSTGNEKQKPRTGITGQTDLGV
jgi:hypothetical protein